jgi:hypothetical protein
MKPLFTGFYCPNECDKPIKTAIAQNIYGSFYGTRTVPSTGNLWKVYVVENSIDTQYIGWVVDADTFDAGLENALKCTDVPNMPGEIKQPLDQGLFDRYFKDDSILKMLRFIPVSVEDIQTYKEYCK